MEQEYTVRFNFALSLAQDAWVRRRAFEAGVSKATIMRGLIDRAMEESVMTMDDIVVTTYTNPRGDEYEAIQLPWETVADILGHEHTGNPEDDTTLVRALRDAGAPAWVEDASGWIDEHGWGLIGPATTLEVLFCEYEDYCAEVGLTGCISYPATITTERAESSYGQPVVVIDGEARGPGEMPPGALQVPEDIAAKIRAIGYEVVACAPADLAETMRRYEQGHELEQHWHPEAVLVQF